MIHRLNKIDEALGVANTVMILNAQEDAMPAGVVAAFAQCFDGPFVRLLAGDALGFASGKNPDMRCAQYRAVVDPFFDVGDLRFARHAIGQRSSPRNVVILLFFAGGWLISTLRRREQKQKTNKKQKKN